MENSIRPFNATDSFMPMLTNLSDDNKLYIIERLTVNLRSKAKAEHPKPDIRKCFSGEWDNDKSTSEIADELRNGRYYEEKNVVW